MTDPADHPSSGTPDAIHIDVAPPVDRVVEFYRTLWHLTPRVYVTTGLIGINVAVWLVMVIRGVSPMSPAVEKMIDWGANYGPLTTAGEWQRLLLCMFLHFGIIHLFFNMWVLRDVGRLVERLVGNFGFAVLYLFSGLAGSVASLLWNPFAVSAGASGAVFGVVGAMGGFLLRCGHTIPKEALSGLRSSVVSFVVLNVILGLSVPWIDMAAHLGGLVAGFLCGLVLSFPITPDGVARRNLRAAVVAMVGTVITAGGITLLPTNIPDVLGAMEEFVRLEEQSLATTRSAFERSERGEITDAEVAEIIARDVLPPWRNALAQFRSMDRLPPDRREVIEALMRYMQARQESWELLVDGIRENDPAQIRRWEKRWSEANQMAEEVSKKHGQ